MPFNKATGKMVPNTTAPAKAQSKTAGPGGSFPIGDCKHAKLAVSAASRSANAGNITPATKAAIQSKARAKLATCKGTNK